MNVSIDIYLLFIVRKSLLNWQNIEIVRSDDMTEVRIPIPQFMSVSLE